MMDFLLPLAFLYAIFIAIDESIFNKYKFSIRDSIGFHYYFSGRAIFQRAMEVFLVFPTQSKIDVFVDYGVFRKGSQITRLDLHKDGSVVVNSRGGEYLAIINYVDKNILFIPDLPEKFKHYEYYVQDENRIMIPGSFNKKHHYSYFGAMFWEHHFEQKSQSDIGKKMCIKIINMRSA